MKTEIISVSSDIIMGNTANENSRFLSGELFRMGFEVEYQTVIPSNQIDIIKTLTAAIKRSKMIIFTGGLGKEPCDITKETVFGALKIPLEENKEVLSDIEDRFGNGQTRNEIIKQAMFPKSAAVFRNAIGSAYGCAVKSQTQVILFLPGKPEELRDMFENSVRDYIRPFCNEKVFVNTLSLIGVSEEKLRSELSQLIRDSRISVSGENGCVQINVYSKDGSKAFSEKTIKQIVRKYGTAVYGIDCGKMEESVVELLKKKKKTVAVAESCTGGLVAKRITDVSGASSVIKMSMVTYSEDVKIRELGVKPDTLREHTVVSSQVASEMALGIFARSKADIGAAVTGVAGPDTDGYSNPVGLVWIAVTDGSFVWTKQAEISPADMTRQGIRETAATQLLDLIRLYLLALPATLDGGEKVDKLGFSESVEPFEGNAENIFSENTVTDEDDQPALIIDDIPVHKKIECETAQEIIFEDYGEEKPHSSDADDGEEIIENENPDENTGGEQFGIFFAENYEEETDDKNGDGSGDSDVSEPPSDPFTLKFI
ncbi:MAG: CinA family nicotinamide mononucleotide deamidase-related protein [Acutalibacteraceae bacterium]